MKRNTVLLIDSNCDVSQAVMDAAMKARRAVRLVTTCREAFQALDELPNEIGVVLVDLEPEAHGLAIIEALGTCEDMPPVIALTDLEESYMRPIVRRHGAVDCIAKPIRAAKLAALLERVPPGTQPRRECTCDRWGHTCQAHSSKDELARVA